MLKNVKWVQFIPEKDPYFMFFKVNLGYEAYCSPYYPNPEFCC